MSVLFDLQGVQSPAHAQRGIARYLTELSEALDRFHPGGVSAFMLNPDLPVPPSLEPLAARARFVRSDAAPIGGGSVYHVGSPFERVSLDRLWPAWAHATGMRVAVTLYDLIPAIYPELYVPDPERRRSYGNRVQLVRRADRILAISDTTARDAVERLGVDPARVRVVGAGVSEHFSPPADPNDAFAESAAAFSGLEPGFLLYTGGIDPRKNLDRLLSAYAGLPEALRGRHQLVVVGRVQPAERVALEARLSELGVAGRAHFPGFVSEELLLRLYQACVLFVFPSLYEGFGLPIAEAMACGAPVIGARTPAVQELVDDDAALFDPLDTQSIRDAIERSLIDEHLRERLRRKLDDRFTWRAVADRTVTAYDELLRLQLRVRRSRTRIAFVSPLPPQRSGVAGYSYRLTSELRAYCDVDAFVDGDVERMEAPEGVPIARIGGFERARLARGGYDQIVYCLGNSEFHGDALALLRRRPGIVLAHDVRLTGLYAWLADRRPDIEPRAFHDILQSMYKRRVPATLGERGRLDLKEADQYGVYMAREVIAHASRYLVHSDNAAQLARGDAAAADLGKIGVLPFAFPSPDEFLTPERTSDFLVSSFGIVTPTKQSSLIVEAFALVAAEFPGTRLALVGPLASEPDRHDIEARARSLGIRDRVTLTGDVDDHRFKEWLARTTVAVQLRAVSNGESSATVATCLSAGVPTIATDLGSTQELSDRCVVKVSPEVSAGELGSVITELLRQDGGRRELSESGVDYARAQSFARTAEALYRKAILDKPTRALAA